MQVESTKQVNITETQFNQRIVECENGLYRNSYDFEALDLCIQHVANEVLAKRYEQAESKIAEMGKVVGSKTISSHWELEKPTRARVLVAQYLVKQREEDKALDLLNKQQFKSPLEREYAIHELAVSVLQTNSQKAQELYERLTNNNLKVSFEIIQALKTNNRERAKELLDKLDNNNVPFKTHFENFL